MKNIFIVGGSSGIGLALVKLLAQEHLVWVASRSSEALSDVRCTHIAFDACADQLDVTQLPEHLDGFVYAPGSINLRPFSGLKPETFAQDMEVNFLAMVRVLQSVLPKLKKSEAASIVLFSTVAVSVGMPFHTSVAAAKGAVEGFARALAAELAPKIRVNVVAPSLTDTPLANKFLNNEQKMENAALRHPLKSVGTADQIAQTAAFLLSDHASWTTGQVLGVDGGMSRLNLG